MDPKYSLEVGNIKVFIANSRAVDQETIAMAQAMYSRTHKSIAERLPELFEATGVAETDKEQKLKDGLANYFLNYGHASIADCGNVTIFFEGVSHLFAKAVEDDALFRGQETSTRYIDYTGQTCTAGTDEANAVANQWLDFYSKWMPEVVAGVKAANPFVSPDKLQEIADEVGAGGFAVKAKALQAAAEADPKGFKVWENTCKARAFDIMRGFLPAGSTTNVAWTGSIRVVGEKLNELLSHPLAEVSQVAEELLARLSELMPSSFRLPETVPAENAHAYSSRHVGNTHYDSRLHFSALASPAEKVSMHEVLRLRKRSQPIPRIYDALATCEISGLLDFGSFRDIQRHRALSIPMPLLQMTEMHPWYLKQVANFLPVAQQMQFREEMEGLIHQTRDLEHAIDEVDAQYAVPMASLVPVHAHGPLTKMIYMLEMRSGKTVHATLRAFAIERAEPINADFGSEVVRCDLSDLDALYLKRGTQTFVSEQ